MRAIVLIAFGMAAASAHASSRAAPVAHNTPDEIVCKLTGSCAGAAAADSSQQIKVGDEKAFSLARPGAIKVPAASTASAPAAAAARMASRATSHAPARHATPAAPPTSSGGLDMLVTFASGSADLTDQGKIEARAFAEAMRVPAMASMKFSVDGHTDAVGNRDYNLDLSKRRAQAVADYLVAQGVETSRLEPHGFGFDKPRPGTSPTASVNRRVEFSRTN